MKIAYVGNFQPRTDRGEPFSTESHISATLEQMGHEVLRIQESKTNAAHAEVSAIQFGADLFLWTRTWPEKLRDGGPRLLEVMRNAGIPTVAYHLDLYAGLPRSKDIDSEPWWRCKYVFTADGGSDEFWKAHGINHVWAPPGVYGPECYVATDGPGYYPGRYDVLFVGSGASGYHPEWPYRKQLIDWLRATYGDRFACFGRGNPVECVRGKALNELYASSKVVVGDSLCLGFTHERYWSDRVPETLGRGGFLVHPHVEGLHEAYAYGKHLVAYEYGDFGGLRHIIDFYLAHDAEREEIRRAGHEHVRANYTYAHRMRAMLDYVGGHS